MTLIVSLAGCSDPSNPLRTASFHPVKGKITLPDGKPLASVQVVFSGPATSTVTTEDDGTFAFKGDQDGLPEGDYKVRLEAPQTRGAAKRPTLPFAGKYLDEDSSGLTAKVTAAGPNDFHLKLANAGEPTGNRPASRAR
jgi:hypothetical protein